MVFWHILTPMEGTMDENMTGTDWLLFGAGAYIGMLLALLLVRAMLAREVRRRYVESRIDALGVRVSALEVERDKESRKSPAATQAHVH